MARATILSEVSAHPRRVHSRMSAGPLRESRRGGRALSRPRWSPRLPGTSYVRLAHRLVEQSRSATFGRCLFAAHPEQPRWSGFPLRQQRYAPSQSRRSHEKQVYQRFSKGPAMRPRTRLARSRLCEFQRGPTDRRPALQRRSSCSGRRKLRIGRPQIERSWRKICRFAVQRQSRDPQRIRLANIRQDEPF